MCVGVCVSHVLDSQLLNGWTPKNACLIITCYDRFVPTLVGNFACHQTSIFVIFDSYHFCDFSVNFSTIVIECVACCA